MRIIYLMSAASRSV